MISQICILGAAPDTKNHGVTALGRSTAVSLRKRLPDFPVTIFDHGPSIRSPDAEGIGYCGARWNRRVWDAHTWNRIKLAMSVPFPPNAAAKLLKNAAAICDISGGDSFTDLYGEWRYKSVTAAKRIAIDRGIPLILLPQTYGPFKNTSIRADAARLCRGAAQAWARDDRSFHILKELLGDAFDPHHHRLGVDVAFLLPKAEPHEELLPERLRIALAEGRPLLGVNISGLIYNDRDAAKTRYGFKADYRELITRFVRWLLEQDEGDVVLIPHVLAPVGEAESDPQANETVVRDLMGTAGGRLHVLPPTLDPSETKWVISQCDWFCGTRMHATIAGLSSGVSTATINYSDKARGVFEGCGVGEAVIDPRKLGTDESLEAIQAAYLRREELGVKLAEGLPAVMRTAQWQMDEIAGCVRELAAASATHPGQDHPGKAKA